MPYSQSNQTQAHSRAPLIVRYVLFATTFTAFALALILNIFGYVLDINLVIHSIAGLVMMIYAPASVILTIKDSDSRFAQAGGEVAYLAIQCGLWLASGVFSTYAFTNGACTVPYYAKYNRCQSLIPIIVLSFALFAAFTCWSIWIIIKIRSVSNAGTGASFSVGAVCRTPVYRVISDEVATPFLPLHSASTYHRTPKMNQTEASLYAQSAFNGSASQSQSTLYAES